MNFIYKMCINSFTLGCPSGYYRKNCSNHQCSKHCKVANNCDRFTGQYDGGCKQDGQELRVITVHLFYCLYKLSFTFKKQILLHFNEKVTDNFKNYKFLACQSGYFGYNCSYQCSPNCNVTNNCDRFTGQCDGGCKPGWTGITCDQSKYV